jgi:hypothetical protein
LDPVKFHPDLQYCQCCQGAEISAAELKRGPTKICAAGQIGGRIFFKYAKKRAEKGPNFFEDDYSYKKALISAEKYNSSPDIFDF